MWGDSGDRQPQRGAHSLQGTGVLEEPHLLASPQVIGDHLAPGATQFSSFIHVCPNSATPWTAAR